MNPIRFALLPFPPQFRKQTLKSLNCACSGGCLELQDYVDGTSAAAVPSVQGGCCGVTGQLAPAWSRPAMPQAYVTMTGYMAARASCPCFSLPRWPVCRFTAPPMPLHKDQWAGCTARWVESHAIMTHPFLAPIPPWTDQHLVPWPTLLAATLKAHQSIRAPASISRSVEALAAHATLSPTLHPPHHPR